VARFAGDEFVVLLEGLRAVEECEAVAQKFVLEARRVTHVDGEDLSVTTSIGIAYLSATGKSEPQRLLKLADQALYETKAKGRNGFTCRQDASAAQAAPSPHGRATLR
jgi:diguanylate cyclase (GGDEF)-like protein